MQETVDALKKKNYLQRNYLALVSVLSILFVITTWYLTYYNLKDYNESCRGTFGDMFGGVNALFSGLAFCGIIITILLQSSELRLQREEIKENRKELVRTTDIQRKQSISLDRQAENLKISARLSALNTLVNYYTEKGKAERENTKDFYTFQNAHVHFDKAQQYLEEIEVILRRKDQ
jgi:hypothetical protein